MPHGKLADGCVPRSPRSPAVGRSMGLGISQWPYRSGVAWRPMVSCAEVAHWSAVAEMAPIGQRSLRRARRSVVTETAPSVRCHGRGRVGLRRGSRAGYLGRAAPLRSHIDGGATVRRLTPRREIVAGPPYVAGPRSAAVLQVHTSRPGAMRLPMPLPNHRTPCRSEGASLVATSVSPVVVADVEHAGVGVDLRTAVASLFVVAQSDGDPTPVGLAPRRTAGRSWAAASTTGRRSASTRSSRIDRRRGCARCTRCVDE